MSLRTIPERLSEVADIEEVVVYETVDVPVENEEAVERFAAGKVDWLCFFSPSAVESFKKRNFATEGSELKVAAIGETTARSARSHGYNIDFISERASAIEFAKGLARHIKDIE